MQIIKRIFKYYIKYWPRILLGLIAVIFLTQSDLLNSYIVKTFIDIFSNIGHQITQNKEINFSISKNLFNLIKIDHTFIGKSQLLKLVLFICGLVLVNILVKGFFVYTQEYALNSVIYKVLRDIRQVIYNKIIKYPIRFYDENKTGELMAKITNDVSMLQATLNSFFVLTKDIIQSLIYLGFLFYLNWQLSLIIIMMFVITGTILKRFSIPIRKAQKRIVENISDITSFLQETLSGIKIIKIFVKENSEINKFKQLTYDTYARNMKAVRLIAFQKPINELLGIVGVIVVILFSGYQMLSGKITISDFGLFIIIATLVYKPLKQLGDMNQSLQSAITSGTRIFELIDLPSEPEIFHIKKNMMDLKEVKGEVQFRNTYFEYKENELILKKINFKAKPGEIIALVGHSGSGKTTIGNLIPRFYELKSGQLYIDGINIKNITIESLRKHIAMVPQDTFLFNGTIKENIAYGNNEATPEEIMEAAKKAHAHNFILRLKHKYDSLVGEKGVMLSGGEKQRIAIARAILKNPKILILDEATSALDTKSEIMVQEALDNLMKNKTTFMIAHRLSTIKNADKILVMENGEILQTGTHKQLIRNKKGLYYQLCFAQNLFK